MTRTEILAKSWSGILKQGGPASMRADGYACCYQNSDGQRCAIGVLLSDNTIQAIRDAALNCTSIDKLLSFQVSDELQDIKALAEEVDLCLMLQRAHDTAASRHSKSNAGFLSEFAEGVRRICKVYELDDVTEGYK